MNGRDVVFLPAAIADIGRLDDWIATEAGEDVSTSYLDRLERFAETLSHFPHRGTPRRLHLEEVRTVTFERRQLLLYRVTDHEVQILRVVDARRDWPALLPR